MEDNPKPVERNPVQPEAEENLPVVSEPEETKEKTSNQIETVTMNNTAKAEREIEEQTAETEAHLPNMSLVTEKSVRTPGREQKLFEHTDTSLHVKLAMGKERETTGFQEIVQTEDAKDCVPLSLSGLQDEFQRDNFQSPTTSGNAPVVDTDNGISEANEHPRRSEHSKRAHEKFTYLQLGNPLISFAQTILEGFNRALVC